MLEGGRYHFIIILYSVEKSPLMDLSCFKSYTFRTLSIANVFAYTGIHKTKIVSTTAAKNGLISRPDLPGSISLQPG